MQTLADLSRAHARRTPHKTALWCAGSATDYRTLDRASNRIAQALCSAGVVAGERVALLGLNSADYALALQAIAKCGAIAVPINFRLTAAEVRRVLGHAQPRLLLADAEFGPLLAELAGDAALPPCWTLGAALHGRCAPFPDADPAVPVDPQGPALILYTSGTTGEPKGVLMSHTMLLRMFAATAIEAGLSRDEVVLVAAPMFHLAGMNLALNQALFLGGTAVIHCGRFEPATILRLLADTRTSLAVLVPTMVGALAADPLVRELDLHRLSKIFYGSMPIAPAVLESARAAFPGVAFTQIYGSTECGMVAVLHPQDHAAHSQCTGREALLSRLRIVDLQGADVPPGGVGEIVVDGTQIGMLGYWRDEAATRAAMQGGWIRSGDLARHEGEGLFTIVDRLKDLIISGGENIYPKEIETVLAQHPAVLEAAVYGMRDPAWGEVPHAAVVLRRGAAADADALLAWCGERLARYKLPRRIHFPAALPRNASDKVVKARLRDA